MGKYVGGVIKGIPINVSTTKASGMFNISDVARFVSQSVWPVSGVEVYHVFTYTQTWQCPPGVSEVEYLIVGGGGGGGAKDTGGGPHTDVTGGGGGAGGFRFGSRYAVVANTLYTITVGAGGAGALDNQANTNGSNGSNTVLFASSPVEISATGGGGGGTGHVIAPAPLGAPVFL